MSTFLSILAGVGLGLVTVVIIIATSPWWLPIVDPIFTRLEQWTDRQINKREHRR
jgi:hypothetical protein